MEREAVLVCLGLIGGVAPVNRLGDLERARRRQRKLAVVAKVLRHRLIPTVPRGNKNARSGTRLVRILRHIKSVRAVLARSMRGDVKLIVSVSFNAFKIKTI